MASTRRLIKETAACYFIGYYIGVLAHIWYLILRPISADSDNMPIISGIPSFLLMPEKYVSFTNQ